MKYSIAWQNAMLLLLFLMSHDSLVICFSSQRNSLTLLNHRQLILQTRSNRSINSNDKDRCQYQNKFSRLYLTEDEAKIIRDSENRGVALFALVAVACIWIFSIPPEFRRAHWCTTEQCVNNRHKCYDCVTFSEWSSEITNYYRSGGGFHLDFTVDPNTSS